MKQVDRIKYIHTIIKVLGDEDIIIQDILHHDGHKKHICLFTWSVEKYSDQSTQQNTYQNICIWLESRGFKSIGLTGLNQYEFCTNLEGHIFRLTINKYDLISRTVKCFLHNQQSQQPKHVPTLCTRAQPDS